MELYFRDRSYLRKALTLAAHPPKSTHSLEEAFLLCLSSADRGQLQNFCAKMQARFPGLTVEECFQLTRGKDVPGKQPCTPDLCRQLYDLALEILEGGESLGAPTVDGKNQSTLWGHLLLESAVAGRLAQAAGLDPDTARKLGILHDFGRNAVGTLEHTVRGFEMLVDLGWDFEALGCLTHSFLAGGRCSSNEQAEKGFYVNSEGKPCWEPDAVKDDVTLFLEAYTYTDYDLILNLADLMATAQAIVSPADRLADIATRRILDPKNRSYFLAELTNRLWAMGARISPVPLETPAPIYAKQGVAPEEIQNDFHRASEAFWKCYQACVK